MSKTIKPPEMNKAEQFKCYAFREYDLVPISESGVRIHPIERNGEVKLAIIVSEETTIEKIRDSWWYILKWRDALREWQGPRMSSDDNFYLHLSYRHKDDGLSYAQIAEWVNQEIVKLLMEYAAYLEEFNEAKAQFKTMGDFYLWNSEHSPSAFEHADNLLRLCQPRLDEERRRELLMGLLDEIQEGSPLLSNEPVTGDDVRERIRYWREKQKRVEKTG